MAGTRVERIAARAGVNKERLYNYLGDKEQLFTTVLSDELAKIAAAVPRDVGEYAPVPDEDGRAAHYRRTVEAFRAAQADGVVDGSPDAADLVFTVMSLAAWWFAVPQVARMVTGAEDVARRRAVVVESARRLAASAQVTAAR